VFDSSDDCAKLATGHVANSDTIVEQRYASADGVPSQFGFV